MRPRRWGRARRKTACGGARRASGEGLDGRGVSKVPDDPDHPRPAGRVPAPTARSSARSKRYHAPMGRRSQTETVAGIYQAFLQRRTWSQSSLAKELDVTVETLRRVLSELQAGGCPFHREEDHTHVCWSVGKDW